MRELKANQQPPHFDRRQGQARLGWACMGKFGAYLLHVITLVKFLSLLSRALIVSQAQSQSHSPKGRLSPRLRLDAAAASRGSLLFELAWSPC